MTSILTVEERTLLRSLGCRDKKQALEVLREITLAVPVHSEMFACAVTLTNKLEHEALDYAAVMCDYDMIE
ncbi:hypothetical protein [Ruminococcus sp. XPD3002]|uniref:hypothetical protein n=1 Tax=Ruminococcus sp. XPD3002 TaxID=1452269 RepID=UPI0009158B95|nr:hypothetical protein SAMN04487832_105119 [Ruminococcus flavefaciens]